MNLKNLNFQDAKVLIIGDVMLDRYWFGGTSRISPEAPVPIVQVSHVNECPGGAANVALGVSALGAKPHLLGIIGQDEIADRLRGLLDSAHVQCNLSTIPNHPTITKLRILSRNQQMIRLDSEKLFTKDMAEKLESPFTQILNDCNIVIFSDYGKGTLYHSAKLIELAKQKGLTVIVDPKSLNFSQYRYADVITPNLKEFEAIVGKCETKAILTEKARKLLEEYDIGALIVTRSEHGLSVVTPTQTTHIPAVAREVHDVTGAGDTVVAVIGAALGAGFDLSQAAYLGNIAAGIAVGKIGAVNVTVDEIVGALRTDENIPTGVMNEENLISAIHLARSRGERIVFTNGCFDILHSGHVLYLEQAKALGDRLVVAVNDDSSVMRLKGPMRPINSVEDRMNVLAGLRSVDWVVPFKEDTPDRIIQKISPHFLVKGGDYHKIEELPGASYVLSQGNQVRLLGIQEKKSTTKIIEKIKEGESIYS